MSGFKGALISLEASPLLMGVGYIIGFRVSCVMAAGGLMAALLLTPAIAFFGDATQTQIYPGTKPISAMSPKDIRDAYILYIGAGAVAAGGIISVLQALPLIASSLFAGLRDLGSKGNGAVDLPTGTPRTDRDLPLSLVVLVLSGSWRRSRRPVSYPPTTRGGSRAG